MYVYKLAPIVDYLPFFELTYFSDIDFEMGDIVDLKFANRKIEGIILHKDTLKNAKNEIRNANFKTQKIVSRESHFKFNIDKLKEIENFCDQHFIAIGEFLHYLFYDVTAKKLHEEKLKQFNSVEVKNLHQIYKENKIQINQIKTFDKYKLYEEKIYEAIKNKNNLMIIFADDMSSLTFKYYIGGKQLDLKKNKNIHILKSKEAIKTLQDFILKDIYLDYIFIDQANFDKNILIAKPHINQLATLFFIFRTYSKYIKNINIYSSNFTQLEKGYFEKEGLQITENEYVNKNLESIVTKKYFVNKIIAEDADIKIKKQNKIEIISKEILNIINEKLKDNKQVFVFVLNHGYTLRIYCTDCNTPYPCPECKKPIKLEIGEYKNNLYCRDCDLRISMRENQLLLCKKCGGFNFDTFGIGISQVYDYLKNNLECRILNLDEQNKKIKDKDMIEGIKEDDREGSIVVGSLRALSAFASPVDVSIVINLGDINSDNLGSMKMHMQNLKAIEDKSIEMYIQRNLSDSEEKNLEKDKHNFWYKYKMSEEVAEGKKIYKVITVTTNFSNKKYLIDLNKIFIKSGEYIKNKQLVNYFVIEHISAERSRVELDNKIKSFVAFARNLADVYVGDSIREFTFIKSKR